MSNLLARNLLIMHRDNPPIEIWRHAVDDGRKNAIRRTASGRTLVGKLERHWLATFAAIASLEEEIGYPLRRVLEAAAKELEREGFSERVATAKAKAKPGCALVRFAGFLSGSSPDWHSRSASLSIQATRP